MSNSWWPWAALVLLGAYHGVNPGMGWLFAVARGMQEHSRKAVLSSLIPIAIGHEASIVIVVVAVSLTEQFLAPFLIRLIAALVLVSFGVYKLARPRTHLGGFGMRVGFAGLAGWSFLMSTAHGAGLMLAPVLLGLPVYAAFHSLRELSLQAPAQERAIGQPRERVVRRLMSQRAAEPSRPGRGEQRDAAGEQHRGNQRGGHGQGLL